MLIRCTHPGVLVNCLQFKLCDQLPDPFLHLEDMAGDEGQRVVYWDDGHIELLDHLQIERSDSLIGWLVG